MLDAILNWAETQTSEIDVVPNCGVGEFPMFDKIPVEPKEVSRQLWVFLGPLVANDANKTSTFKNVARHNGFEACRQIAMPINDDKILILQELLPLISNPKSVTDIHHSGFEAWRQIGCEIGTPICSCSGRPEVSDRAATPRDWRSPRFSRLKSWLTSPYTWTSRSTRTLRSCGSSRTNM